MTREDIIRMTREAGGFDATPEFLERFAALVAAATAKEYEERLRFTQERWEIECKSQVEIEREACAEECVRLAIGGGFAADCAAAIRARGQE